MEKILHELKLVGIIFIVCLVATKIIFFRESIVGIVRFVLSIFIVMVLPGYALMLYWKNKIGFALRLVLGSAIAASIVGTASYYLGLMGFSIKYHLVLPLLLLIIGLAIGLYLKQK